MVTDRATGGWHTLAPTSPNPTLIQQQRKKRSRSESDEDGYEPDSESEVPAGKTKPRPASRQLKRYLSEKSSFEEYPAKRMRRIENAMSTFDRQFWGCPHSSTASIGVGNSSGPCGSISRNTSTSTLPRRMSKSRRRRRSIIMSRYMSRSMSGSTGTAGTCTLPNESPIYRLTQVPNDRGYLLGRYLNESSKEGGPMLAGMNDSPGMLFSALFFLFFFHSYTQAVGLWDYCSFLIRPSSGIVHSTFRRP